MMVKTSRISITIIIVVVVEFIGQNKVNSAIHNCASNCTISLIESIPEDLKFSKGTPVHASIFEHWVQLIALAEESIDIATYYVTLKDQDGHTDDQDKSSWQGEKIFDDLMKAGTERNIRIRIVKSYPTNSLSENGSIEFEVKGAAEVRILDLRKLIGRGIQYANFFIIDEKHFYIGSASMDWRSLTQVKELGVAIYNCSRLAKDLSKIFEIYWTSAVPNPVLRLSFKTAMETEINSRNPLNITMNGSKTLTYITSSPPCLTPEERTHDLDAIVDTIRSAKSFVYVSVTEYMAANFHFNTTDFWTGIDTALRIAITEKGQKVRILASSMSASNTKMISYLKSLRALKSNLFDIEVKLFVFPNYAKEQRKISMSRINHNKYMVTDHAAYIGTSNWVKDYFTNAAGVGIVFSNSTTEDISIRKQLENIFMRDWNSEYAQPIVNCVNFQNFSCCVDFLYI